MTVVRKLQGVWIPVSSSATSLKLRVHASTAHSPPEVMVEAECGLDVESNLLSPRPIPEDVRENGWDEAGRRKATLAIIAIQQKSFHLMQVSLLYHVSSD